MFRQHVLANKIESAPIRTTKLEGNCHVIEEKRTDGDASVDGLAAVRIQLSGKCEGREQKSCCLVLPEPRSAIHPVLDGKRDLQSDVDRPFPRDELQQPVDRVPFFLSLHHGQLTSSGPALILQLVVIEVKPITPSVVEDIALSRGAEHLFF